MPEVFPDPVAEHRSQSRRDAQQEWRSRGRDWIAEIAY
jgi:hypothetical protein